MQSVTKRIKELCLRARRKRKWRPGGQSTRSEEAGAALLVARCEVKSLWTAIGAPEFDEEATRGTPA